MINRTSSARPAGRRLLAPVLGIAILLATAACTSSNDSADNSSAAAGSAAAGSNAAGSVASSTDASASVSDGFTPAATEYDPSASQAASVSVPPAVTTPVPAPGGGDISQTVAAAEMTTQAPVALDQPGDFGQGVTVVLDSVDSITTTAQLPGEIAGPGLALNITITNGSNAAIDLSTVVVDVVDGAGTPAITMTAAPSAPFAGELAAGQKAAGVYVVTLPAGHTDPLAISVTYSSQAPVVLFTGATP